MTTIRRVMIPRLLLAGLLAAAVAAVPPARAAEDGAAPSSEEVLNGLFAKLAASESEEAADLAASSIWRIWLDSGSDTVDLLLRRAIKALDEKEFDTALLILDEVVYLAPDYAEGWNRRATVHYLMRDYDAAVFDVARALEIEPRHFGAMSGLGTILKDIGRDDAALSIFRRALAVHPHLPDALKAIDDLAIEVEGREI